MTITKCDVCKKQIRKHERTISATTTNPWGSVDLCETCGRQILDFLKKHNLAPKED